MFLYILNIYLIVPGVRNEELSRNSAGKRVRESGLFFLGEFSCFPIPIAVAFINQNPISVVHL